MTADYRYGRLGRHYLCLDQTAFEFLTVVLVSNRTFAQGLLGVSNKGLVKSALMLLAYGFGLKQANSALAISHRGQIALRVNGGVRVIDFRTQQVTKVFGSEIDASCRRAEIESVKKAATCSFTPRLIDVDQDVGWFTEELWPSKPVAVPIRGFTTNQEHKFLRAELGGLAASLAELASVCEPKCVDCDGHLAHIMQDTSVWLAQARTNDPESVKVVERFIGATVEQLDPVPELFLTFSHGDFSLLNIIASDGKWKVIDWEDGRARTALTDFYSLFTTELYYGRDGDEIVEWAKASLENLVGSIETVNVDLGRSLRQHASRYRSLAHLERLRMLMSRGADERRIGVVRRSAEVFERFDRQWPIAA